MALYALADRRGCELGAILDLSASERNHWLAYYSLIDEGRD